VLEVNEHALEGLAVLACHLHHVNALNEAEVGLLHDVPDLLAAHVGEHVGDAEGRLIRLELRKIDGLRHNFFSVTMAQGGAYQFYKKSISIFFILIKKILVHII